MGRLTETAVLSRLQTHMLGRSIRCCGQVDSTFKVMREMEKQGVLHGSVVTAEEQTQGRGRFSRKWESSEGKGLYFNLLLRPDMETQHAARIIPSVAVGVCKALRGMGFDTYIKWPNDIVISSCKVCGMLAEMGLDGQLLRFVSVGIGLNIGQSLEDFPEELRNKAGSLALFTDAVPDRADVLAQLLLHIEEAVELMQSDFPALLELYRSHCITLGREVQASGGADIRGMAVDVNEDGELIVRDESGAMHILRTADVSVRGVMGYV